MPTYRDKRSGRWRYRKLVQLPDGSKQRISGTPDLNTKVAAERTEREHIERAIREFYEADAVPPTERKEVPTFDEWFNGRFWREWVIGRKNKPSEQESKESIYRVHLKPHFGALRLDEIGPGEVAAFRAHLVELKRSDKRINNILAVLSKALRYASDVGLIEQAPRVGLLRVERPEIEPWSIAEYAQLVCATSEGEPGWLPAVLLAGEAGLRIGEIRALEWRDVDLEGGLVHVRRQSRRGHTGTPKGRTRRVVPMTNPLRDALARLSGRRSGFVLGNRDGSPLRDDQTKYHCYQLCSRAKLTERGWHALRHSFGTHAAMFGVNPWTLMMWMGHKRIDETMLYVNLARNLHVRLPATITDGTAAEADPDVRALRMLGNRGNSVPTKNESPRIAEQSRGLK